MALVTSDQLPKAQHPGEEALDVPAAAVASEGATILCLARATRVRRRDHLHAHRTQLRVERVAVVGPVTDEPLRQLLQEPLPERFDDELRFIALTTRNPDGDRKAMAVCHCHDLGRFAASSDPNSKAPLFAPA